MYGVLVVHRHQGVGDGGDHGVARPTGGRGQVERGEAGGVEDGDGHGDGEDPEAQLVGSLQADELGDVILEEDRIQAGRDAVEEETPGRGGAQRRNGSWSKIIQSKISCILQALFVKNSEILFETFE